MMNKIVAVVLLCAVMPVYGVASPASTQTSAPARCHEHGGRLPSRSPATHACCEVGHQAAILVQSPGTLRARLLFVSVVSDSPQPIITSAFVAGLRDDIA